MGTNSSSDEVGKRRWKWLRHMFRLQKRRHPYAVLKWNTWNPSDKRVMRKPRKTLRRTAERHMDTCVKPKMNWDGSSRSVCAYASQVAENEWGGGGGPHNLSQSPNSQHCYNDELFHGRHTSNDYDPCNGDVVLWSMPRRYCSLIEAREGPCTFSLIKCSLIKCILNSFKNCLGSKDGDEKSWSPTSLYHSLVYMKT